MTVDEVLKRIEALKLEIEEKNLSTKNLLQLVPKFRLDWGSDENDVRDDFNIGVTKPIILSGLANSHHKLKATNLLVKNNKIAQLLVDTFITEKKLSKELLFTIHENIILNGGKWRTQDVIVNDITYAVESIVTDVAHIDQQISSLIAWYNKESSTKELHPLLLSTMFHYNFVKIHPFLDGNGRLARVISSLILLANSIPPPIFEKENRYEYINCLRKADLGDYNPLVLFIGKKVVSSMEYVLSLKNNGNV